MVMRIGVDMVGGGAVGGVDDDGVGDMDCVFMDYVKMCGLGLVFAAVDVEVELEISFLCLQEAGRRANVQSVLGGWMSE